VGEIFLTGQRGRFNVSAWPSVSRRWCTFPTPDGCFCCQLSRDGASMNDPIIARVRFADGSERAVFEQLDGRQYVLDDNGDRLYGVWFIPDDAIDLPFVVDCGIESSEPA
jgi:hypothetical protein